MSETLENRKIKYITFLLISFLFLFFLINETKKEITGFFTAGVNIESKTRIRIIYFDYPFYPDLGEFVNVSVEVQNHGSTGYNEKIEIFIKNSTMNQLAYYYDALTELNPGDRKSFKIIYLPPDYGIYYIQLRVSYAETKRIESWGAFIVSYDQSGNGTTTPPTTIPEGGDEVEGAYGDYYTEDKDYITGKLGPSKKPGLRHEITIEAPDRLDIPKGETMVTYVKVNNVGNSTLHSLKSTIYTQDIEVDIFPKFLISFPPNTSSIFMLSIKTPFDIEPNLYSLDLEFSSNEIDVIKKIILNITDLNLKDIVYQTIINYKYIIVELENQILDASENGIKVSKIQMMLEAIKVDMNIAEDYYDKEEYTSAYEKLQKIRIDIQDLLMAFAIINIPKVALLKVSHIIVLIGLLLLIIIITLVYLIKKSRKKLRRPKLLRESQEPLKDELISEK